jgi:hypothetical protein
MLELRGQVHASAHLLPSQESPIPFSGMLRGVGADLNFWENRLISCICRGSKPVSCSPQRGHYTDYDIAGPLILQGPI